MFELIYRYDPDKPSDRQTPVDAADACRLLEEGNRTFAALATGVPHGSQVVYIDLEDIGVAEPGGVLKQQPFAVVLGCSDARVPTELIFDRACNELFVVRVAGNILGQEQLGSIDYAVDHLGDNLKLVVVLGHSQCGAVTAAVDAFLTPADYLSLATDHHVRAIVNTLFPAVRGATRTLAIRWGEDVVEAPGYHAALIECSVTINAALMAAILRKEFGEAARDRRFVFGVYDLHSRRVHVPAPAQDGKDPLIRLQDAPRGREEFRRFALEMASSPFIRGILGR